MHAMEEALSVSMERQAVKLLASFAGGSEQGDHIFTLRGSVDSTAVARHDELQDFRAEANRPITRLACKKGFVAAKKSSLHRCRRATERKSLLRVGMLPKRAKL